MCWTSWWDEKINRLLHINTLSERSETFQRGSGRPFATADIKKLIFWAAYSVPDLFNCKHKPFISTVLMNANRLLTYVGLSHG